MNYYKVLVKSFINLALQEPGAVVLINDDPNAGGMRPGSNLVACDEQGNEVKALGKKPPVLMSNFPKTDLLRSKGLGQGLASKQNDGHADLG